MEKPKLTKKELIFNAACSLFITKGYAETRIIDIAEKAGIGKGTVYEYFSSKEDLFYQLFSERMEKPAKQILNVKKMDGSASERLLAYLKIELDTVRHHSDIDSGNLQLDMINALELLKNEKISEGLKQIIEDRIQILKDIISDGIQTGEFSPVDPMLAAVAVLGAVNFCMGTQSSSHPENSLFTFQEDEEQMLNQISRLILKGLTSNTQQISSKNLKYQ